MSGKNTSSKRPRTGLVSRRDLLIGGAAGAVLSAAGAVSLPNWNGTKNRSIPGEILGGNSAAGHRLRKGEFPRPSEERLTDVVIVGGGVAGLSAARELSRSGIRNFSLLELDRAVGGNSQSGANEVSAFPWGAHYVPLPGEDAKEVRELFEDLDVITGYDAKGLPRYNEFFLCADPHERLFMHGKWQVGIEPRIGTSSDDQRQFEVFGELMKGFHEARGSDGKRAFTIPVDRSSRDTRFLALDEITFADFLTKHSLDSKPLLWYLNYCCRDDYGTEITEVSAWAAIHYFASRGGEAANAESSSVLTWPEGNGWLVKRLRAGVEDRIQTNSLVYDVQETGDGVVVDQLDVKSGKTIRWRARSAVLATPLFVTGRIYEPWRRNPDPSLKDLSYAPWVVANIKLKRPPEGHGAPLSWDNVSYHSESLGYIVATHQSLRAKPGKTVITYYLPFTSNDPKADREKIFERSAEDWKLGIANDLEHMHHGITESIERIDIWLWGHAMIRPEPGVVWGNRKSLLPAHSRVALAHSDLTGISIFEEAYTHGIRAAREVAQKAGLKPVRPS